MFLSFFIAQAIPVRRHVFVSFPLFLFRKGFFLVMSFLSFRRLKSIPNDDLNSFPPFELYFDFFLKKWRSMIIWKGFTSWVHLPNKEVSISYGSKIMAKVKVLFCHRQNHRQDEHYSVTMRHKEYSCLTKTVRASIFSYTVTTWHLVPPIVFLDFLQIETKRWFKIRLI